MSKNDGDYITLVLFLLGCALFAFSRFYGLSDFPIYFFCDEAFVGNESRVLLENGFRDEANRFLPLYYQKAPGRWVPQIIVYLSLPSVWMWPGSVYALRAVTVVISLSAGVATCFTVRALWPENRWWWLPIYFFCSTPVWFLHSRLAFETTHAVAFFSIFISGYLLYRWYDPRWVWLAFVAAVFAFYSHLSGTTLMVISVPIFALLDIRYHLRNMHILLPVLGCSLISMWPCINWLITMPQATLQQLDVLHSPWVQETSWWTAAQTSAARWIAGLDPTFWWSQGPQNQSRHTWKGRDMIPLWSAPIILSGILACVIHVRKKGSLLMLLLLPISVTPLLLVESHIMRGFYILAPLGFLVASGAHAMTRWTSITRLRYVPQSIAVSALLSVQTLTLTREALSEAPRWYSDYGLFGLQWGSRQLFGDILPRFLDNHPLEMVQPPGQWANGPEQFPRFFLSSEHQKRLRRVSFSIATPFVGSVIPPDQMFILSSTERRLIEMSGKYKPFNPILEVRTPNNSVAFVFTKLEFADNFKDLMAEEVRLQTEMKSHSVSLRGENVIVDYPQADIGDASSLFDGNPMTVLRGLAANPFTVAIRFDTPIPMSEVTLKLWEMNLSLKLAADTPDGTTITKTKSMRIRNSTSEYAVLTLASAPVLVTRLLIEIENSDAPRHSTKIHVREIEWRSEVSIPPFEPLVSGIPPASKKGKAPEVR